MSLVELEAVARVYPGPVPVTALLPTDLRVEDGDFVGIVGPSGSGKSTLLNLLGLLDRPTGGRYYLAGTDTTTLDETCRTALRASFIGFVFQAFHLLPTHSAAENVELGMLYSGTRAGDRRRRARVMLERVGLGHRLDALPSTLSGGERQRVAIARALVTKPRLLLCDEPTGNLDSATSATVLDLIGELNEEGITVVVVTHDPTVAARARRRVSVADGTVTA